MCTYAIYSQYIKSAHICIVRNRQSMHTTIEITYQYTTKKIVHYINFHEVERLFMIIRAVLRSCFVVVWFFSQLVVCGKQQQQHSQAVHGARLLTRATYIYVVYILCAPRASTACKRVFRRIPCGTHAFAHNARRRHSAFLFA